MISTQTSSERDGRVKSWTLRSGEDDLRKLSHEERSQGWELDVRSLQSLQR